MTLEKYQSEKELQLAATRQVLGMDETFGRYGELVTIDCGAEEFHGRRDDESEPTD